MKQYLLGLTLASSLVAPAAFAEEDETACVMKLYNSGSKDLTIKQMRAQCSSLKPVEVTRANNARGILTRRIESEQKTAFEPYVVTPHKINYFLPAYSTSAINTDAYTSPAPFEENFRDIEAKFQLSLKVPMNREDIFTEGDALFLGFTIEAWWQVYASQISRPFRETNYQPEIFYAAPFEFRPFEGNSMFVVGLEHQSNGRSQPLSRSWNRLYMMYLYEKENFVFALKPWYRLSENEKSDPLDPTGDDNPDILDYMGHYEMSVLYRWDDLELGLMSRYNFKTHNGAGEMSLMYPIWGNLKGYATLFSGYGDSLIDYNHKQTRLGLGIALNYAL